MSSDELKKYVFIESAISENYNIYAIPFDLVPELLLTQVPLDMGYTHIIADPLFAAKLLSGKLSQEDLAGQTYQLMGPHTFKGAK